MALLYYITLDTQPPSIRPGNTYWPTTLEAKRDEITNNHVSKYHVNIMLTEHPVPPSTELGPMEYI